MSFVYFIFVTHPVSVIALMLAYGVCEEVFLGPTNACHCRSIRTVLSGVSAAI